ncbi:MAG: hypothetical protein KA120_04195 [Candidatus Goldbacteria bacterium]|nr:hypothetical protein [Candidatus Goldiibacteriota bacterium]
MKKLVLLLLLFPGLSIHAGVYDFIKNRSDVTLPFISCEIQKMQVRINDNKMDIVLLESEKSSGEILDNTYKEAEKNGCVFFSDETILYAANLLYEIAGKKKYDDEFGYVFYKDRKDKITFVITAGDGRNCEIIRITTQAFKNGVIKGFNDEIEHFYNASKVFCVEILSENGGTINFANFYRVDSGDRYEIRNFYDNALKKKKFNVLKKYYDEKIDFYILERKNRNYLLAISEKDNEDWILVIG